MSWMERSFRGGASMTEDHALQLEGFLTAKLGDGWRTGEFIHLNAGQVVEALWPMNDVFRQHHAQIGSLAYSPSREAEADQALVLLANGGVWTATAPSPGAWRVLLERHTQCLTMALTNDKLRVPVPKALKRNHYKAVAMLFWQWGMALPFPIENRSSLRWPAGPVPGNLLQH